MNDITPAVRASDTEREHTAALLQRHYADGRLTLAELEERTAAAYSTQTTEQLTALAADLPAADEPPSQTAAGVDPCLLCLLLCVCPPAGIAYWLRTRRRACH